MANKNKYLNVHANFFVYRNHKEITVAISGRFILMPEIKDSCGHCLDAYAFADLGFEMTSDEKNRAIDVLHQFADQILEKHRG